MGSACLDCDSSCATCSGTLPNQCLSCYSGKYLFSNNTGKYCQHRVSVGVLKFELIESPQLYLLELDTLVDLEAYTEQIRLYQISNSLDSISTSMSEMSFTLIKLDSNRSYQLNFISYTESNETRSLLLSFDKLNQDSNNHFFITPSNSTAPIVIDSSTVLAADVVGTASLAIYIATAATAFIMYLQASGKTSQLMRVLQIMARIIFMKLVNVNHLTPLAVFYKNTDLGQFGLPNIFSSIPGSNDSQVSASSSSHRLLAQSLVVNDSNGILATNFEGTVIINDYFTYTFNQVFLDNYGGIVSFTCIVLILYPLVKAVSKCFKDENSKIKKVLVSVNQSFERSIFITLLVSRYMYLCSALILNYAFIPLDGTYQQFSFAFAVIYTILLALILILAILAIFYHRQNKAKMKSIRPLLNLVSLLCHDYHSKSFLGRIMTFWTLFSDLVIILVIELLGRWIFIQLGIFIALGLVTIIISLPKAIFKTSANKILVIGTELGFIIISIVFLVLNLLQNSGGSTSSYTARLALSWVGVGVNNAIILFHLIVRIAEFIRERIAKMREKQKPKFDIQDTIEQHHELKTVKQSLESNSHASNFFNDRSIDDPTPKIQRIQLQDISVDGISFASNTAAKQSPISKKQRFL